MINMGNVCLRPTHNQHTMAYDPILGAQGLGMNGEESRRILEKKDVSTEQWGASECLTFVAHGELDLAKMAIASQPQLLLDAGDVTDYSGRSFKAITAYEYAYWAQDWEMCSMLESYMDSTTKARVFTLIQQIENEGLNYHHHGVSQKAKHFDFSSLIETYLHYLKVYDDWTNHRANLTFLDEAWFRVGMAQKEVPVFVAQQYCRFDRSFHPTPRFRELSFPRTLSVYHQATRTDGQWFPLSLSEGARLGIDFAIYRGRRDKAFCQATMQGMRRSPPPRHIQRDDLKAVLELQRVCSVETAQAFERLNPLLPDRLLSRASMGSSKGVASSSGGSFLFKKRAKIAPDMLPLSIRGVFNWGDAEEKKVADESIYSHSPYLIEGQAEKYSSEKKSDFMLLSFVQSETAIGVSPMARKDIQPSPTPIREVFFIDVLGSPAAKRLAAVLFAAGVMGLVCGGVGLVGMGASAALVAASLFTGVGMGSMVASFGLGFSGFFSSSRMLREAKFFETKVQSKCNDVSC